MPSNRSVSQYLESLARSGVTHLPRAEAPEIDAPPGVEDHDQSSEVRSAPSAVTTAARSTAPRPAAMASPEPERAPPVNAAELAASITDDTNPEERAAALCAVADLVKGCTRCTELAETRTQTVFGVGDPSARLLFIGEAPGADEDRQGEPFVGRAGQLLTKIIEACGLRRSDVYICNVLRCRPPGNRNPTDDEAANCREYLDAQLAIVRPEYIVCWGAVAARNLLDTKAPIGRLRGELHEHTFADSTARVLCTYHPSYLLRNPAAKKDVWDDMKFLFRDMGVDLDAKG